MNTINFSRKSLLGISSAALLIGLASPALAQVATVTPNGAEATQPTSNTLPGAQQNTENQADAGRQLPSPTGQDQGNGGDVVVTGTLFRTQGATPSPVTTLTAENLDQRGINTVQDAIQQLSSSNGPALTNSFTANGAFAGGASAVSLRGLSSNSTLVLFDGLRAAYYPLADDGSRNFVDLNTIPDDIVDHIDVLRDGASSSYGADAIAGVVNIITKRNFHGLSARAEAGVAQSGIAPNQRLTLTAGFGDLDEKGYNFYVSGFYQHQGIVKNRELPYPFNTGNQNGLCGNRTGATVCGPNNITNGVQQNGNVNFGTATDYFVIPYSNVGYANGVQNGGVRDTTINGGRYTKLNAASNCVAGPSIALNAASLAASATAPLVACQEDRVLNYGTVSPNINRHGASARFTGKLGETSEVYAAFNYEETTSGYDGAPSTIRGNANTGINFPRFSTSTAQGPTNAAGSGILALPVFVCPRGTTVACTAANGTLNPNNPFARQGDVARLLGAFNNGNTYNETRSRVYRGAIGVSGTVFGDFDYKVDATAMHTDLQRKADGYVYIQHLLDVINDGSYNFVNPQLNSAATIAYLTPENLSTATSDLDQVQATLSKAVFQLPGGPLQVAVGGSVYYEAVNAPSFNNDTAGPTQRYFVLNAFGTVGHRTVASGFYEINAPILTQLELNTSGRYDHYSSGQSAFSPKVGAKFTPIRQLAIRGTWSRGFRIPAFAEANALPTTGFVSQALSAIPQSFLSQYGATCSATNAAGCSTYVTAYSIGQTTLASPNLRPEKSRSFTGGIVFEPFRNLSFTVDYYNIKKTGAITSPSVGPVIAAYYAGQPIPAGFTLTPDAPDVNNPNSKPRIAFIASQLINANTIKSEGIDFGANLRHNFGDITLTSNLDASLILELSTTFPDGTKETYVDTLGNFNLTAGTGTFRWKGNWQNTVGYKNYTFTATANYTSGYNFSAQDQGTGYEDCSLAPAFQGCRVKSYITFDINGTLKINDKFAIYGNVLNLFNRYPPLDAVTYGAYLYNAVQAGNNIYGRRFLAGVKVNF